MNLSAFFRALVGNRASSESRTIDQGRIGIRPSPAGVRVTADNALESSAVWACHRYLTQTVAQLPARVMRDRGNHSERVRTHPVVSVFTWRANPELSPFQLKETLTGWAIMRGNGIAEIERDAVGRVVALWPIHPDRVRFLRDAETDDLIFRVDNGVRGTVDLAPGDVFHLRGFGNGPVGLSVVEHAAQSLGWARAVELFGAAYFGNGLNAGGVIEIPGKMTKDGKDRLRAEAAARHGGVRRSHIPLMLDNGMKWIKSSFAPDESQFLGTMQHQVEEVCRWFGVPPQKVGHLLRMTFNNVEMLSIEVVVDSITPWAIRWEEEANYKLFGQNRMGFFLKMDLKGLLRGDFKSRQEGLQLQRRNGIINADEWRDLEDMGPMPGTDGKKYIVEQAMTTLAMVGEAPSNASLAAAAPVDPQPNASTLRTIAALRRLGREALNAP